MMRESSRRLRWEGASDLIRIPELLRAVFRRLPIVLAAGACGLAAALLLVAAMEPVYKASTTLIVVGIEGAPLDYNAVQLNRTLARTYVEVARSRSVALAALEELGSDELPQALLDRVRVTNIGETELILITVTDHDPRAAATTANTLAEAFRLQVQRSMGVDNLRVVDTAAPPMSPDAPRPLIIVTVLGLFGLCAGIGVALLLERLGHPVR